MFPFTLQLFSRVLWLLIMNSEHKIIYIIGIILLRIKYMFNKKVGYCKILHILRGKTKFLLFYQQPSHQKKNLKKNICIAIESKFLFLFQQNKYSSHINRKAWKKVTFNGGISYQCKADWLNAIPVLWYSRTI